MASTGPARAFQADPYDYGEVRRLASELELAEPVAVTLVRRGYRTVDAARRFLEARESHEPTEFRGMEEVCELHPRSRPPRRPDHDPWRLRRRRRLLDRDPRLDAPLARRDLRLADPRPARRRLRADDGRAWSSCERRGTELVITVGLRDRLRRGGRRGPRRGIAGRGHRPPPARASASRLPDRSTRSSPSTPSRGSAPPASRTSSPSPSATPPARERSRPSAAAATPATANLDMVALATVADMVPLVGENRRLVREGLRLMRDGARVGLRALMAAAAVDPQTIDAGALGFRLAPRINAAGRLYRADAGVELMLTDDRDRAAAIAEELDRANAERRWTEQKVVEGAERARSALPASLADAPALVLTGEGWHPGVVGIAASRMVERHFRPTILLSVDGDRAKGSARSIPGFDLVAALDATSEHLGPLRRPPRRGRPRARCRRPRRLPGGVHRARGGGDRSRGPGPDGPPRRAGRSRPRRASGWTSPASSRASGPSGWATPDRACWCPPAACARSARSASRASTPASSSRAAPAARLGVAFGMNGEITRREDQAARSLDRARGRPLERGRAAARRRPRALPARAGRRPTRRGRPCGDGCPAPDDEWWERLEHELASGRRGPARGAARRPGGGRSAAPARRPPRRRRRRLPGRADLERRVGPRHLRGRRPPGEARLLRRRPTPLRRRPAPDRLLSLRGRVARRDPARGARRRASRWPTGPRSRGARRPPRLFSHVVVIDPPPSEALEGLGHWRATGLPPSRLGPGRAGADRAAARPGVGAARPDRRDLARRSPRRGGEAEGADLRSLLAGASPAIPRTPETAARCVRVLSELGLCEWRPDRGARALRVLSSERTELGRSRAYADCLARHQEAIRFLRSRAQA